MLVGVKKALERCGLGKLFSGYLFPFICGGCSFFFSTSGSWQPLDSNFGKFSLYQYKEGHCQKEVNDISPNCELFKIINRISKEKKHVPTLFSYAPGKYLIIGKNGSVNIVNTGLVFNRSNSGQFIISLSDKEADLINKECENLIKD